MDVVAPVTYTAHIFPEEIPLRRNKVSWDWVNTIGAVSPNAIRFCRDIGGIVGDVEDTFEAIAIVFRPPYLSGFAGTIWRKENLLAVLLE